MSAERELRQLKRSAQIITENGLGAAYRQPIKKCLDYDGSAHYSVRVC